MKCSRMWCAGSTVSFFGPLSYHRTTYRGSLPLPTGFTIRSTTYSFPYYSLSRGSLGILSLGESSSGCADIVVRSVLSGIIGAWVTLSIESVFCIPSSSMAAVFFCVFNAERSRRFWLNLTARFPRYRFIRRSQNFQ